ncbi:hypothetical protein F3K34_27160 [Streptomyces sp. LBUM 1486]|uniref:hypothetical protein n=1 Tax=Streptomyces scabiei TaxID=1930 RepID=UPI001B322F70|nr:hypothetical protein [Streptomyces sp. LBUM 1486]MBP5915744.1 hypothetical protein [Streptomyces sp. LBUM 1486]
MSEATAEEREEQLVKLRRRMGRLLRRGETAEFDRLSAEYGRLKGEHVLKVHEEHVAARRALRAAQRVQQRVEGPKRWKLPRGFASPLAAERARSGVRPREEPSMLAGGLHPWRRAHPMAERIWRP